MLARHANSIIQLIGLYHDCRKIFQLELSQFEIYIIMIRPLRLIHFTLSMIFLCHVAIKWNKKFLNLLYTFLYSNERSVTLLSGRAVNDNRLNLSKLSRSNENKSSRIPTCSSSADTIALITVSTRLFWWLWQFDKYEYAVFAVRIHRIYSYSRIWYIL